MKTKQTLASIFEINKQALEKELTGLVLPKDASKVQYIVSKYLNKIFDENSDYRQSLTIAEDYILNAAIELLNVQQSITKEISTEMNEDLANSSINDENEIGLERKKYPYALTGSALGAVVGSALGTWGALFGAVAGTAIILYGISNHRESVIKEKTQKIDPYVCVTIVKKICEKIDYLIEVFRVQVQNIKYTYTQENETSLKKDYSFLIDAIQNLLIAAELEDEDINIKLDDLLTRINLVSKALESYGLEFVGSKIVNQNR